MSNEDSRSLPDLLKACCVQVSRSGTGFFICPNCVLTCAHVVGTGKRHGDEIDLVFQNSTHRGRLIDIFPPEDLAFIETDQTNDTTVILGLADGELIPEERLLVMGYPDYDVMLREIGPLSVVFDGITQNPKERRLQFKGDAVVPGFSGSPLLNLHTAHVVGIVKETKSRTNPLGGWAVPTEVITQRADELKIDRNIRADVACEWYRGLEYRFDPSAQFRQPDLTTDDPKSTQLYYYGSRRIQFFGRQDEMKLLDEFLAFPAPFAWYLITGSGGLGKSRLALEFCLKNRHAWRAGFINKSALADLAFWQTWRPNRPTLLVADYAAAHAETLGEVARCAARAKGGAPPCFHTRLLLIEREKPEHDHFKRNWFDEFIGKGYRDRETTLAAQYPERDARPLELKALSDDDTWRIIDSIAPHQFPAENKHTILDRLRRLDPKGTPLFAAFLAGTADKTAQDRYRFLTDVVLRREQEVRWGCATEKDLALVAIATLCGGVARPELMARSTWLDEAMRQFSRSRYQSIVGKPTEADLAPLEPDILGEVFLLELFRKLDDTDVDNILNIAWSLNVDHVWTLIVRIVQDFPEQEALRTLLKPPDVTPRARSVWAWTIRQLLDNMPAQYLDLGIGLYEDLKKVAARYPDVLELHQEWLLAAINLIYDFRHSQRLDQAGVLWQEVERLIVGHPDERRGRQMRAFLVAYEIGEILKDIEAFVRRPLGPSPLTFVQPVGLMRIAREKYDELCRLCDRYSQEADLREWRAQAAFHLVIGYSKPAAVSHRVGFPAFVSVLEIIDDQMRLGRQVYKSLGLSVSKYPNESKPREFLAKSASALTVGFANLGKSKETSLLCKNLLELANRFPGEPELRVELARSYYNLVFALHHSGENVQARNAYNQLSSLAGRHPDEVILREKSNNAARLLGIIS